MHHTGTLYVSAATMLPSEDGLGNFHLQLFAADRHSPIQQTAWCLLWQGTQAQAFFEQHKANGLPVGMALQVTCKHARPHYSGTRNNHIVAHVVQLQPEPKSGAQHTNATPAPITTTTESPAR